MEGLHVYNEMKDIGQMLLGRLGKFQLNTASASWEGICQTLKLVAGLCLHVLPLVYNTF